jgi:hypothetical protein
MIEVERGNQTKGAQTKMGVTIERNTAFLADRGGQLDKIRFKAPLQKNIADLRIAQVDISLRPVIELDPLIVGRRKNAEQTLDEKMPSKP